MFQIKSNVKSQIKRAINAVIYTQLKVQKKPSSYHLALNFIVFLTVGDSVHTKDTMPVSGFRIGLIFFQQYHP